MISYKDKPLELLTLEETIEFEKEMRKKSLAAAKHGMSETVIDQINFYISLISQHKSDCIKIRSLNDEKKGDGVTVTLGEWEEPDNEADNEK
ncbi:MAG: hypothetical protein CBD74_14285 [Saprospirales bacterium TMED214]|nr:MAG: hypothetical protein CBD74_14285 [Saprospirales bacterium TMED214]